MNPDSHQRTGMWAQTFTGRMVFPADPRPDDFCIEDIAHSLALQCRFNGMCRVHYSVAQHSICVSKVARQIAKARQLTQREQTLFAIAGFKHDAQESHCQDVIRPLKVLLLNYPSLEDKNVRAMAAYFRIPYALLSHEIIKIADDVALRTEKRDLFGPPPAPWTFRSDSFELPEKIKPLSWRRAEKAFLTYYKRLRQEAEKVGIPYGP